MGGMELLGALGAPAVVVLGVLVLPPPAEPEGAASYQAHRIAVYSKHSALSKYTGGWLIDGAVWLA